MSFKEVTDVHFYNKRHRPTLCGHNVDLINIKLPGIYGNHCYLNG